VVVLISSSLDDDILASYREGADGYVRKPVTVSGFSEAVNAVSTFWPQLNEEAPEHVLPPDGA
jgi:DNA-binding NarL/FixJ family response regulator